MDTTGLEIPVGSMASALARCSSAFGTLHDALVTGDPIKIREAADAIRNDASRLQALSAVVSRYITERSTRHTRKL